MKVFIVFISGTLEGVYATKEAAADYCVNYLKTHYREYYRHTPEAIKNHDTVKVSLWDDGVHAWGSESDFEAHVRNGEDDDVYFWEQEIIQ